MQNYWLMKSEPKVYSIHHLQKDQHTLWDGVRNYQARNFLRQMKKGDFGFFYHSNVTPPGIVGLMQVIETNIIDPTQFDPLSPYFDPNSQLNSPRWYTVKVEFLKSFSAMLTLSTLKENFNQDELLVIRRGNRLSVMPVEVTVAQKILHLSESIRADTMLE